METQNREIAIQLSDVKKMYKLGQIGGGTLKADLQSWWAKKHGKVDPNSKIGQEERLVGQTFMALNGIDLTVYKGEALGIIGGNGAGKSTLLKLLSQVTAPTDGQIDLYGRVASMLEVGTGFNGEMTGRENIYMNGAILGMTKAEIDAKMEDIIEFSEVREFIDTPVKRYSSGMYVKLAFSVAAHLDSEIMIMDEVLAVGDMAFQKKCLDKMREVAKKEGRTVLYVSHNMNTIRQLCDRCVVLEKGKKVFDGDVEKAIALYMKSDVYKETFIDYTQIPRHYFLEETRIHTLSAELIHHTDTVYRYDEPMIIKITWKYVDDVSDLYLRVELKRPDRTSIGSSILSSTFSGKKDTVSSTVVQLDLNNIVPGSYTMHFVFFVKDEFGNYINEDVVYGQFFDIVERTDIIWNSEYLGNVLLSPLKIIEK